MIDDFYQAALETIEHHLDEAGVRFERDDGELLIGGHRLGLSITFEGFVPQGAHTLAPLDVQIHIDGDSGDRFRVGALGVGNDRTTAMRDAIAEWHLLAVAPLLAALGADLPNRRTAGPRQLATWDLFAGRVGIRGRVPGDLRQGGVFYRTLLEALRQVVSGWEQPSRFVLHSIYVMATRGPEAHELQAAVDGLLDESLTKVLSDLEWPVGEETYLYKQLFVLRHQGPE